MKIRGSIVLLLLLVVGCSTGTYSAPVSHDGGGIAVIASIRGVFESVDADTDVGQVKILFDGLAFNDLRGDTGRKDIDTLSAELVRLVGPDATPPDKLKVLRKFLYEGDPSSGRQPFTYDLKDPFGEQIRTKTLASYLQTHKGNCVSMPILFLILGQRIGLDVTLSTLPEHFFVKIRDKSGRWLNIETTSGGGFARDEWMLKNIPASKEAIANGIYMQPLTKKEVVSSMLGIVMERYDELGRQDERIELADMALEAYPNNISAMLHKISALLSIREQILSRKRPGTQQDMDRLNRSIAEIKGKIDRSGWRPLVTPAG